jgi:hypothetical protein
VVGQRLSIAQISRSIDCGSEQPRARLKASGALLGPPVLPTMIRFSEQLLELLQRFNLVREAEESKAAARGRVRGWRPPDQDVSR